MAGPMANFASGNKAWTADAIRWAVLCRTIRRPSGESAGTRVSTAPAGTGVMKSRNWPSQAAATAPRTASGPSADKGPARGWPAGTRTRRPSTRISSASDMCHHKHVSSQKKRASRHHFHRDAQAKHYYSITGCNVVGTGGIEPPTSCVSSKRSPPELRALAQSGNRRNWYTKRRIFILECPEVSREKALAGPAIRCRAPQPSPTLGRPL